VSTGRVVAVDLPHYQHHHHHLQSCWWKNLGLEAVILKTVAKVGVACRPPCPQKRNISPRCCLNPLRFLVFDSETADKHCNATTALNSKLSTDISRNFCKAFRDNAPSPHLTTETQLRVTKITYLYDPDPTFHSIN